MFDFTIYKLFNIASLFTLWYICMHMKKGRKNPKRLIINIEETLHKEIKLRATERNMSISDYVRQAVAWRLINEKPEV